MQNCRVDTKGLPASEVMRFLILEEAFARAERNDPCSFGSGKKIKHCHVHNKGGSEGRDRKQKIIGLSHDLDLLCISKKCNCEVGVRNPVRS